jgi:hypothetical protein
MLLLIQKRFERAERNSLKISGKVWVRPEGDFEQIWRGGTS